MTVACFSGLSAATTGESRGAVGLGARTWGCPSWKAAEGESSVTSMVERSMCMCVASELIDREVPQSWSYSQ